MIRFLYWMPSILNLFDSAPPGPNSLAKTIVRHAAHLPLGRWLR